MNNHARGESKHIFNCFHGYARGDFCFQIHRILSGSTVYHPAGVDISQYRLEVGLFNATKCRKFGRQFCKDI